jgi:DNA polymerase III epsilon subunit-like protein
VADRFILLDTETGGLDPEHNGIIELAAMALDAQLNVRENVPHYHRLIRPEERHVVSEEALKVNNHYWVKDKKSEEYRSALPYELAWADFMSWLTKFYPDPRWIILTGWNVSFDEAFLRYLHAYPNTPDTSGNSAYVNQGWPFHYHKIDFLGVCRYLDLRAGRSRRTYKLEKMAEHYFGAISEFAMHTALGDSRMALQILKRVEDETSRANGLHAAGGVSQVAADAKEQGHAGPNVPGGGAASSTREG